MMIVVERYRFTRCPVAAAENITIRVVLNESNRERFQECLLETWYDPPSAG